MSMKLRTEIEPFRPSFSVSHDDRIVLLGSCFSDNIGSRLVRDGFEALHNPLGPLYNPLSLARLIENLLDARVYTEDDFVSDSEGGVHCLDFASRYQHPEAKQLVDSLNSEFSALKTAFDQSTVLIITFGSSVVYSLDGTLDGVVGNCHKFPADFFRRMTVSIDDIADRWQPLVARLKQQGKHLLFTVSPIRHLADGLHGNQLSKARLLLACEKLSEEADYFPAYEIMMDDLRDYRFYERDLKHPSELACDYIYDKFSECFFSQETASIAAKKRQEFLRSAHRPIINNIR
ncbi:MAG: GSCFA domain-containing protein [Muribaculaceae bacterium]|nr:GSCFA domain-containing protein [Muribaculaceae bacterium]